MEFLVIKDGAEFGTFGIPEITLFLEAGQLSPSDCVRVNGRDIPLSSIPELRGHGPTPSSAPAIQPKAPRRRLKGDPARLPIYDAIRETIRSEMDTFLRPFQADSPVALGPQSLRTTDFLVSFPSLANTFIDNCCQRLVKIIRSASIVPAMREAATPDLAKRIRDMAFRRQDEILGHYVSLAKRVQVFTTNIQAIQDELSPKSGTERSFSFDSGTSETGKDQPEWATPERLDQESASLARTKLAALTKIKEYIESLQTLPDGLLSYACDKCFAAETDFEFERQEAGELRMALDPKLTAARQTFDQVTTLQKAEAGHHQQIVSRTKEQNLVGGALDQMTEKRQVKRQQSEQQFTKILVPIVVISLVAIVLFLFLWQKLFSR